MFLTICNFIILQHPQSKLKWKRLRQQWIRLLSTCCVSFIFYLYYYRTKCRVHWENAIWTRDRKYFCKDHKMVLCNTCHIALHLRWCTDEILDKKDVQECIDYIKSLLSKIITNSETLKVHKYIKDFDSEIKGYWDSLNLIEQRVSDMQSHFILLSFRNQLRTIYSQNSEL